MPLTPLILDYYPILVQLYNHLGLSFSPGSNSNSISFNHVQSVDDISSLFHSNSHSNSKAKLQSSSVTLLTPFESTLIPKQTKESTSSSSSTSSTSSPVENIQYSKTTKLKSYKNQTYLKQNVNINSTYYGLTLLHPSILPLSVPRLNLPYPYPFIPFLKSLGYHGLILSNYIRLLAETKIAYYRGWFKDGWLKNLTLLQFLDSRGYAKSFVDGLMMPLLSVVCTCGFGRVSEYPANVILGKSFPFSFF